MRAMTICVLTGVMWASAQAETHEQSISLNENGKSTLGAKENKRIAAEARGKTNNEPLRRGFEEETTNLDEEGETDTVERLQIVTEGTANSSNMERESKTDQPIKIMTKGTLERIETRTKRTHGEREQGEESGKIPAETRAQAEETQTSEQPDQDKCTLASVKNREARRGERLIATLNRWGEDEGWTIVTKTRYDWPIEAAHKSTQRLDKAILELTEGFKLVQPAPKATAYGKNCVIVIRDNAARSG